MRKNYLLLVTALILAVGLNGCFLFKNVGAPSAIVVRPDSVEINLYSGIFTVEVTATVQDEKGNDIEVDEEEIEWAIADSEVASLSETKGRKVTVEGKEVGETALTVSFGDLDPVVVEVKVIDEEIVLPEGVYKAPKVSGPLAVGEEWPVDLANAWSWSGKPEGYEGEDELGFNVWVFWDDDNVYIQWDVVTPLPLENKKTERYIFEEDSLEWEINVLGTSDKQKWMFALTEEKGYEVLVRYPDRVYYVVGDQDPYHQLEIAETDNVYRGQAIISMEDPGMAPFNIGIGTKLEYSVQVNDCTDDESRTRLILGGFVDNEYRQLWFMYR